VAALELEKSLCRKALKAPVTAGVSGRSDTAGD
jgi:hypothetical protein